MRDLVAADRLGGIGGSGKGNQPSKQARWASRGRPKGHTTCAL